MNYKLLGRSGLAVSPICLGTMMFGGRTATATAARIVDSARDAGINFIDTADVYNDGASEKMVGKLIKPHRDHWVLATKVGNPMGPGPNERGLGRRWIIAAADASLKRLGTDVIDVYYLHLDDHAVDLADTVATLGDLVRMGKIRHWGFSNFRAYRFSILVALAEKLGVPHPVVSQPYYNAMNRMPEVEVLPACAEHGIGVVPYSPLARGVLTGKYDPDATPRKGTRAGDGDMRILETEFRRDSLVMAQTIKAHAESRGMTAGQFALNWVLNNRLITSVLAGPRTLAQWTEYLGALTHDFTAEDEALVDSLVPAGHPSTPGYSDPRYPVVGRVAETG
ncbi:MAG: aldo/keto reductase [Hyphomicrobiales bacterium]|nr:aldo/keto reductase [Hyphomicrobiales bacterium]MCP5374406.1 aldo/keto reductase [Hyphomicrobiales bacterium]